MKLTIHQQALVITAKMRELGPGARTGVVCDDYKTEEMIKEITTMCPECVLVSRSKGPTPKVDTLIFTIKAKAN